MSTRGNKRTLNSPRAKYMREQRNELEKTINTTLEPFIERNLRKSIIDYTLDPLNKNNKSKNSPLSKRKN